MRNEMHLEVKWLQRVLRCIHGFSMKSPSPTSPESLGRREAGYGKETEDPRPADPLRGIMALY